MTKNNLYHFYPSAKSRRELKIKTSGVISRGASADYGQNIIAPPKQAVCQFLMIFFLMIFFLQSFLSNVLALGVKERNVRNRLKCFSPKFEAEWSHPRRVNSCSKFCKTRTFLTFSVSKNEMSGIV